MSSPTASTPVVRQARCGCGTTVASRPDLPFFTPRGPGMTDQVCRQCRMFEIAHRFDPRRVSPEPDQRTRDHAFEPLLEGEPFDSFYCGCRGWD